MPCCCWKRRSMPSCQTGSTRIIGTFAHNYTQAHTQSEDHWGSFTVSVFFYFDLFVCFTQSDNYFFYLIFTTASEMRSCVTTVSHSVHTCSMSQLEGEKKHTALLFYKCRHPPFSGALLSLRKNNLKHKSNSSNKYKEQRWNLIKWDMDEEMFLLFFKVVSAKVLV